jgi:RepB DNA-primase from phage plasmid
MNSLIQPAETGNQTNDTINPFLEFGKVIDLHPVYAAMAQAREAAEANGTELADVVWDPAWPDLNVDNEEHRNGLIERNWETLSRWYAISLKASRRGKVLHIKVRDEIETVAAIDVAPPSIAFETIPDTQPAIIPPLDGTGPQATDFIKAVFGQTNEPVHFCSLGNERDGTHPFRKLDTRNPDEVTRFIERWDMAGRGLFYCVSTLKAGAHKRNKENVAELPILFADIDLKDVKETVEEIEFKLKTKLRLPPTVIVRSGNGVHAIWMLKEAIDLQSDGTIDRVEGTLRQLADVVGGDLQVCEVARLLRLPGTHNTKRGEFKEVTANPPDMGGNPNPLYELDDIEEWLGEQSPIILRIERPRAVTVGQAVEADPYLVYAKEAGHKTPIDVKARLDRMMYMAIGEDSVHETQISVESAMINSRRDRVSGKRGLRA